MRQITKYSDLINFTSEVSNDFIFVKINKSLVKIRYEEISYIQGLKDYVKIYNGKKFYITKCTIKHLVEKLPQEDFLRIHKSYIVSISQIDKIEFNFAFINGAQLPIGTHFKESINNLIDHYRL